MVGISLYGFLLSLDAVHCFRISSKVDSAPEYTDSSTHLYTYQRSLDSPYPDHSTYEAVFAGIKNPIAVDCTQPGVICKFPLVVVDKETESVKPAKNVKELPVIIKGSVIDDTNIESRDDSEEKSELTDNEDVKVPVIKGSFDIEHIAVDQKDIEDTWILEKNTINKKYKIPVKLVPSQNQNDHNHNIAPIYPTHHDFHDHFSGGDSYHFVANGHGSGWTPWMRAYPSVYTPSNHPCQPPVYHQPPPCSSSFVPTRKPTINIDDKVDKEAE